MHWNIPLSDLDYGKDESDAVERVLRSKWLSMGPEVECFEKEFANLQDVKYAVAVSSATAALHLAFLAAGIGPGDEVIQPALNFVAAANMTVACGACPIFADVISLAEPTINPTIVSNLMTRRSKAVVVMHYGGNLCRMSDLRTLCRQRGILLIEDACHAVGAHYNGELEQSPHGAMAGSIGELGTFSFFANKNMATGEGGMVVTNSEGLATKIRLLRSHGMTSLTWDRHKGHATTYDVAACGYNYRLDELHAALGRVQLSKLSGNNERRRKLLYSYKSAIGALDGWIMPFCESIEASAAHLMVAVAPSAEVRDKTVNCLRAAGVQTSMHYPSIADFSGFARVATKELPITREFVNRAITLPLYPTMTEADVNKICALMGMKDPIPAKV